MALVICRGMACAVTLVSALCLSGCADDPVPEEPSINLALIQGNVLALEQYHPMAREVHIGRAGAAYIATDIQQVVSVEPQLPLAQPKAINIPPSVSTAILPSQGGGGGALDAGSQIPQQTYQVFFDFAASRVTAASEQILKQAAANVATTMATTISVTGHTDSAGSDQFNLVLSLERAKAVKAALMKFGVPEREILIAGEGKANPLVPTADGVREPQNRRVVIVIR